MHVAAQQGLDLLTRFKSEAADVEVILMTAHGSLDVTMYRDDLRKQHRKVIDGSAH